MSEEKCIPEAWEYNISNFYKNIPELTTIAANVDKRKCIPLNNEILNVDTHGIKLHNKIDMIELPTNYKFYRGYDSWITESMESTYIKEHPNHPIWLSSYPELSVTMSSWGNETGCINVFKSTKKLKFCLFNKKSTEYFYNIIIQIHNKNPTSKLYTDLLDMYRLIYGIDITSEDRKNALNVFSPPQFKNKICSNPPKIGATYCNYSYNDMYQESDCHNCRLFILKKIIMPTLKLLGFDGLFIPQHNTMYSPIGEFAQEFIIHNKIYKYIKHDVSNSIYWQNWTIPHNNIIPWDEIKQHGFSIHKNFKQWSNKENDLLKFYYSNLNAGVPNSINSKLVILSLNCHNFQSINAAHSEFDNINKMLEYATILNVDIILLQENYSGYQFNLNNIMKESKYYYFHHAYGLSIYSRTKIKNQQIYKSNNKNHTLAITCSIADINICNIHLHKIKWYGDESKSDTIIRNKQLSILAKNLKNMNIVAGGFNEISKNIKPISGIKHILHKNANKLSTVPDRTIIDHFYVSKNNNFKLQSKIIPYPYSDHNIIVGWV